MGCSLFRRCDDPTIPPGKLWDGVVAEACSVGLPVYLTNQVNLWREVVDAGAGVVENDDPAGIQSLVDQWMVVEDRAERSYAAKQCFEHRLHIDRTVENLCKIFEQKTCV